MQKKFTPLTDSQWQIIEKIIGKQRKSKHSLRGIINSIFWLNYTGVQWREMKEMHAPWETVYYHFRQMKLKGVWEQILQTLVVLERKRQEKEESPSLLSIDSQSVKIVQFVSDETGIDGNKKIKGRKRTILVDTLGLPWAINVSPANVSDNEAGIKALEGLKGSVPRMQKITADNGYKLTFTEHIKDNFGWEIEITQRPQSAKGFIPQKNRWQVERSFSWLNFRRRLFKDVEKLVDSSVAMLQIAFISLIINRL
jgi:putative transposase